MLSGTAPDLAARLAERLFLTPRKFERPSYESKILESADMGSVRYKDGWLPTWTWSPAARTWDELVGEPKTILFVHGWEGRGSQVAAFVAPLVHRGFRVVTFDAPGHGGADMATGSLIEHARAVAAVAERPLHAIIGHSVGGAAALISRRYGARAKKYVLVAPPTSPERFTAAFARIFDLDPRTKEGMIARLEDRYGIPFAEIDARIDAKTLDAPLLVIHDEKDRFVPLSEGRQYGGELVVTHGLGHHRILRDPKVVETVTHWL